MWVYLLRRELVYPPRARALMTDLPPDLAMHGRAVVPKRPVALKATKRRQSASVHNTVDCDRQHGG